MNPARTVRTKTASATARIARVTIGETDKILGPALRGTTWVLEKKSAIAANVSTMVAPAPVTQSHSGSGRSKRWPKPCAAAARGAPPPGPPSASGAGGGGGAGRSGGPRPGGDPPKEQAPPRGAGAVTVLRH